MNHKRFQEQLSQLVASPSVSSYLPELDNSNLGVIELLATWLSELGFQCEIQTVAENPKKANLIACKGSGPGGLVLAGHSDTVPCNPSLWQQDPYTLTRKDNRFYGLGATDMKGFFPVVLAALESYRETTLQQPIFVLATADEETTMSGARAIAELGRPKARYAVIGEPTDLRPIRMHKGIMFESVRIEGQAAHSSNPALGRNAMDTMSLVLNELKALREELQTQYSNPGFLVPTPTLNFGCIHGGDSPNRICGQCEMHFDVRFLPGMALEDLRSIIHQRLTPLAEQSGTSIIFHSLFPGVESFAQEADSELVTLAESLCGHSADAVAFATEAPFLKAMGMETIVLGPGSIDQAHQKNEYISENQIKPAVNIIQSLIKQFCV